MAKAEPSRTEVGKVTAWRCLPQDAFSGGLGPLPSPCWGSSVPSPRFPFFLRLSCWVGRGKKGGLWFPGHFGQAFRPTCILGLDAEQREKGSGKRSGASRLSLCPQRLPSRGMKWPQALPPPRAALFRSLSFLLNPHGLSLSNEISLIEKKTRLRGKQAMKPLFKQLCKLGP